MNGEVKEITMKEFFAEYRNGTMTEARVKQILEDLYQNGWDDRNLLQVKANKINRKTRKFETDEFKDVLKRLTIFADNLEMSPITMEFKDKLVFKIIDNGGETLIEEVINVSCSEYKCLVSLDILSLVAKTLTGENFTLFYNSDNSIAFEIPEVKIIAGLRTE